MSNVEIQKTELWEGVKYIYRGLWVYSTGARRALVMGIAMMAACQIIHLFVPYLIGQSINALEDYQSEGFGRAGAYLGLGVTALLAGLALHFPGRLLERNAALQVRKNYLDQMFSRLLTARLDWHGENPSSETAQRLYQSGQSLLMFSENQFVYLKVAISFFGPIVALSLLSNIIGFTAFVLFVGILVLVFIFERAIFKIRKSVYALERVFLSKLNTGFANLLSIAAIKRQDKIKSMWHTALDETVSHWKREFTVNEARWALSNVLSNFAVYGLIVLFVILSLSGNGLAAASIQLGAIYMIYEYSRQLKNIITEIVTSFSNLNGYIAGYSVRKLLDDAPAALQTHTERRPPAAWQNLNIKRLRFNYSSGEPLFSCDGLTLERGKAYALVGQSGAGKSSLLKVLAGLQVCEGIEFQLDGEPYSQASIASVATLFTQEVQVFDDDLLFNITLGETLAPSLVADSLAVSTADQFLTPDQLSTNIDSLSGGQKQRIAIARACLATRKSSMILLDEPGASLDFAAEVELTKRILSYFSNCCVIYSTHNNELLSLFDGVVEINGGVLQHRPVASGVAVELQASL